MKKLLLKISGEYLSSDTQIFDKDRIESIAQKIADLRSSSPCAIYVVVGGGNICRGRELKDFNFSNGGADHIGMLSTVQNSLILKKIFDKMNQKAHVMTPFAAEMMQIHPYQAGKAKWWAEEVKSIVIFGGGLGLCGFSTDMTAVSRAYEVGADIIIKVTEVGGLFTEDPKINPNAELIHSISAESAFKGGYQVMDEEAFSFAKNKKLNIKIIKLDDLYSRDFLDTGFGTLVTA